ncbi:hypothetical protein LH407_13825 [Antiquaquibacter oligotrophicus]|nr:hypothetical protein [Antiquaquibacter oligotrophicus]UDF13217.1 hypothetical protein LH407_13825 [Antiquaquibacter oligotrophicus]
MSQTRSPGWYAAPDGSGEQWWNGVGWSESRRGASAPVVTAPRVVYSAANPAPQEQGATAGPGAPTGTTSALMTIDARSNPRAIYALVAGVLAIVFNLFLVPSILAIVFGVSALSRAKTLAATGAPTLSGPAIAGLVLGILGALGGIVQAVLFIFSIVAGFSGSITVQ